MKGVFEKNDLRIFAKRVAGFRGFPPMFHTHAEMLYVLSGEIRMTVTGRERILRAGEIGIVFPYAIHAYENAPDAEAIILMFAPDAAAIYEKSLLSCKPELPCCKDDGTLLPVLSRIVDVFSAADEAHEKIAAAYLAGLIGEILLKLKMHEDYDAGTEVMQKVLTYCSANYTDENISTKSVAQALFISQSYVTKIFSQKLGYGFREYINTLRLTEAKRLLKNTDLKITEIMLRCGFKNQSSFNRVFMDDCGLTPRAFRESVQNKPSSA